MEGPEVHGAAAPPPPPPPPPPPAKPEAEASAAMPPPPPPGAAPPLAAPPPPLAAPPAPLQQYAQFPTVDAAAYQQAHQANYAQYYDTQAQYAQAQYSQAWSQEAPDWKRARLVPAGATGAPSAATLPSFAVQTAALLKQSTAMSSRIIAHCAVQTCTVCIQLV